MLREKVFHVNNKKTDVAKKVFHVDKNKIMLHQKKIFCAEKVVIFFLNGAPYAKSSQASYKIMFNR